MQLNEKEIKREFKKKYNFKYYRSPIRYKGSKFSLVPILLPIFNLSSKKTFVDLFGGSGTVSINVCKNLDFDEVIYNELDDKVFNIFKMLVENDIVDELLEIQETYLHNKIRYYNDDYKKLSDEMKNKIKNEWKLFKSEIDNLKKEFVLYCNSLEDITKQQKLSSFSVGARSIQKNKKEEIKNSFGLNIKMFNKDYRELNFENSLIYLDPPYLATNNLYSGWNENNEIELLSWIEKRLKNGNDFVLSNVSNNFVEKFSKKFNYVKFDKNYKAVGGNYKKYEEIIVTNLNLDELFGCADGLNSLF